MDYLLEAQDLIKEYGDSDLTTTVINHLNLNIPANRFTVIMGPSGSGKSTLLYLLAGLDQPSNGTIKVMNSSLLEKDEDQLAIFRRKNVGFVFQDHHLLNELSLEENIMVTAYLVSKDRKIVQEKIRQLMEAVGIYHLKDRLPSEISGGERQRCAIVRALINSPALLMADEPTGSLNSQSSVEVMKCFEKFHNTGQSILMVTHDISAAVYGDTIYYIRDGRFIDHLDLDKENSYSDIKQSIQRWLGNHGW